ncbi:hypothetical protein BaRGS_00014931 [Batillaria attramentaria]|uniref:LRRNT domain-containing protein n=1 Tax=Batillaria attramentaria TaxID=370345 RepID=A0ABD0L2U6_9CAEN
MMAVRLHHISGFVAGFLCVFLVVGNASEGRRVTTGCTKDNPLYPRFIKKGEGYACGDSLCSCNETYADCSSYPGTLPYVPRLPTEVDKLTLSNNTLLPMYDTLLWNVSNVVSLDLSHSDLANLTAGVFRFMVNLTTLILSSNRLTFGGIQPVLSVSTL